MPSVSRSCGETYDMGEGQSHKSTASRLGREVTTW